MTLVSGSRPYAIDWQHFVEGSRFGKSRGKCRQERRLPFLSAIDGPVLWRRRLSGARTRKCSRLFRLLLSNDFGFPLLMFFWSSLD
jgi:hypothetical protein